MIQFQTARVQSLDVNSDRDVAEADGDPCGTLAGPLPVVLLIVILVEATLNIISQSCHN